MMHVAAHEQRNYYNNVTMSVSHGKIFTAIQDPIHKADYKGKKKQPVSIKVLK